MDWTFSDNIPQKRRAQQDQAKVGRDQTAGEIGGHLLALYGCQIEWEKGIFDHGGRGVFTAGAEGRWTTNLYLMSTNYTTFATTPPRRDE